MSKCIYQIISLLLLITICTSKGISKDKVVIAINCGGQEYKSASGFEYEADNYYDKGSTSDHGLNYEIQGTEDVPIYQSERWSPETLTYSIPLSKAGKYTFILKFSEVYFNRVNEKVFDVSLGNLKVIKNLDIYKKVGRETAYDEYVEFELKKGKVYYKGKEASGAYDEDEKKIKLKFLKGSNDNPKINGIVLIKGTIQDTDYNEKKKAMEAMNKKKAMEKKKKYMLDLRHSVDEEYDEEALLNSDSEDIFLKKDEGIFSVFLTTPGIGIIISVVLFFGLNYVIDAI